MSAVTQAREAIRAREGFRLLTAPAAFFESFAGTTVAPVALERAAATPGGAAALESIVAAAQSAVEAGDPDRVDDDRAVGSDGCAGLLRPAHRWSRR